jgi:hypothetical protein
MFADRMGSRNKGNIDGGLRRTCPGNGTCPSDASGRAAARRRASDSGLCRRTEAHATTSRYSLIGADSSLLKSCFALARGAGHGGVGGAGHLITSGREAEAESVPGRFTDAHRLRWSLGAPAHSSSYENGQRWAGQNGWLVDVARSGTQLENPFDCIHKDKKIRNISP